MGKTSRPFPTGQFRLYKTKRVAPDKPYPVQIQYSVNSVAVRRYTGYSVMESDWNPSGNKGRGGVKASYGRDYQLVNSKLMSMAEKIEESLATYCEIHGHRLTVDAVRDIMDGKSVTRPDRGLDFAEYTVTLLRSEHERNKIGISVLKNGESGMRMFAEFLKWKGLGTYQPDKIYLSEITPSLVEKYILWRKEDKHNGDATINHSLTPIIKAVERASIEGYVPVSVCNAIRQMRIAESRSLQNDDEERVRNLSDGQIRQLIDFYNADTEPRRKEYVEMFLFSLYACGLRVIDILTLQWSNIDMENRTISKIQVKMKNRNVIPLSDKAIKILDSWRARYPDNRFVFGLIPNDFDLDDSERLYSIRNTKTRGINQSLAVVGKCINLPFDLTFHVARHTFGVQSLNQGLSMSVVSQLLGHNSTEITERVYAHYLPTTLAEQLSKIKLPDFG